MSDGDRAAFTEGRDYLKQNFRETLNSSLNPENGLGLKSKAESESRLGLSNIVFASAKIPKESSESISSSHSN